MIKRILVPTDFSDCSVNALKYAAQLAKRLKVDELLIMNAYTSPVAYSDAGVYYDMDALTTNSNAEINDKYEVVKNQIPELKEVNHSFTIQNAFVLEATKEVCSANNIDLIVMGTKGATGLEEVLFGSTTYAVIKNSTQPVLVVPENATYRQIHKVALASDYKEINASVLEPLKALNQAFHTEVHVVHISKEKDLSHDEIHQAKKYEQYLHNVPHQFHYLVNEDIEDALKEYVQDHKIDLVTLIPRKHKFYEMLFGSAKSKPIIVHADMPLLVLPE